MALGSARGHSRAHIHERTGRYPGHARKGRRERVGGGEREERRGTRRSEDGAGVDPGQRSMRRLRRRRPRLGFAQPLRRDMPEVRGDTQAPRRARLQGEVARAGQGRVDAARARAVQVNRQRRRQRRVRSREAKSFDVDEEESEREAGRRRRKTTTTTTRGSNPTRTTTTTRTTRTTRTTERRAFRRRSPRGASPWRLPSRPSRRNTSNAFT